MNNKRNSLNREDNSHKSIVEGWLEESYSDLFNNGPLLDLDSNCFPVTPAEICLKAPQEEKDLIEGSITTTPVYSAHADKVFDVYNVLRSTSLNANPKKSLAFALGRQIHYGGFSHIHAATVLSPYIKKEDDDTKDKDFMWEVTDKQVAVKIIAYELKDDGIKGQLSDRKVQQSSTYHEIGIDPLDEISASFMLTKEYDGKNKKNHVISSIVTFLDSFPQYNYIFLVMPLYEGGELLEYVISQTYLYEDEARMLFIQILKGVSQCHRLGIVHMDLSLENVLFQDTLKSKNKEEKPHLIIIDFGACVLVPTTKSLDTMIVTEEKDNLSSEEHVEEVFENECKFIDDLETESVDMKNAQMNGIGKRLLIKPTKEGVRKNIGKVQYTCPELLMGNIPWDGFAVDLWSCGIMLFIMLTGREPWRLAKHSDFYYSVVQKDGIAKLLSMWGILECPSNEALDLLERMLKHDPNERLTRWKDIIDHPWFQGELQLDYE